MGKPGDIVAIVDDNDNVLQILPYQDTQPHMRRRDTATVLCNNHGQILIAKRHAAKKSYPNRWSVTASGTVESHEDYAQNAKKELAEELGIDVQLRHVGTYQFDLTLPERIIKRFTGVFYGEWNGETADLVFQTDEVSDARWIDLSTLRAQIDEQPDLFVPGLQRLLDLALQHPQKS